MATRKAYKHLGLKQKGTAHSTEQSDLFSDEDE